MLLSLTYVQALLGQSITLCVDGKLVRPVFVRLSCRACSMLGLVMTHVDRQGFGMCQALGCQGCVAGGRPTPQISSQPHSRRLDMWLTMGPTALRCLGLSITFNCSLFNPFGAVN